jgi:hypothetical protein
MAAAGLKMSYFDPIISKKKSQLFRPRHIGSKICEEGYGVWLSHIYLQVSMAKANSFPVS